METLNKPQPVLFVTMCFERQLEYCVHLSKTYTRSCCFTQLS